MLSLDMESTCICSPDAVQEIGQLAHESEGERCMQPWPACAGVAVFVHRKGGPRVPRCWTTVSSGSSGGSPTRQGAAACKGLPAQLPPVRPAAARPPRPSAAGLLISACIGIILMIAAWVILLMRLAANYDMIRVRGAPTAKRGNKMRMFFPKHVRLSD